MPTLTAPEPVRPAPLWDRINGYRVTIVALFAVTAVGQLILGHPALAGLFAVTATYWLRGLRRR